MVLWIGECRYGDLNVNLENEMWYLVDEETKKKRSHLIGLIKI